MAKIVCQWRENGNRYMVNPDGQVFQCCFLKKNFDRTDEDCLLYTSDAADE